MERNIDSVWTDKVDDTIDSLDYNINKRATESFSDLIWKTFKKGDLIPLSYKSKTWEIIKYQFDTSNNKVLINGRAFIVKPLEWTIIDKVKFDGDKFIIYWKMWIIDWKLEATYEKTIKAIDEIYLYTTKNK